MALSATEDDVAAIYQHPHRGPERRSWIVWAPTNDGVIQTEGFDCGNETARDMLWIPAIGVTTNRWALTREAAWTMFREHERNTYLRAKAQWKRAKAAWEARND